MESYKDSSIKRSILAVFFLILGLSACSHWQGDSAKIVISFGGAGRGAYDPNDSETHQLLEHQIVFTGAAETLNFTFTGGTTFETSVAPGKWNILVNSYLNGEIYATGSKDVVLKLGENNEIIEMYQAFFTEVPGNNLAQKLKWLSKNAVDGGKYKVNVTGNESIGSGNWLGYEDKEVSITLTGGGTVNLNDVNNDLMFNIGPNITLILENITLKGRINNRSPLVGVGGTLIMNEGAVITGNSNNRNNDGPGGGGVGVGVEGRFIMKGGTISNNKTIYGYGGGGVDIYGGTFDMSGGIITGNSSGKNSGGVSVNRGERDGEKIPATFKMSGGTISNNTAVEYDGGVSIGLEVEFTMSGTAIISNNNAQHSGGVGVWGGTFTMNGGEISGNIATIDAGGVLIHEGEDKERRIKYTPTFYMNGGSIYNNTAGEHGGGVRIYNGNFYKAGKPDGGTITENNAKEGIQIWVQYIQQTNGGESYILKNRNDDVEATESLSFIYNGTNEPPIVSNGWDDGN